MRHDSWTRTGSCTATTLACCCAIALLSAGPTQQAGGTRAGIPSLDGGARPVAAVDRALRAALERTGVRAAAVALADSSGLLFVRTIGDRVDGPAAPADERTVFRAASLGKAVFAYLVFTLVRDGSLDLDTPLHRYLPKPLDDYAEYADIRGDLRYQAITARMCLSHRTGLPNWRWQMPDGKLRILFNPGEQFLYSGEGYRYLQFVIERTTGQDLDTLARDRVFWPLGMTSTSYSWHDRYARNCAIDRQLIEKVLGPEALREQNCAGSLLTTATDYGRFLGVVLNGGGLPDRLRGEMLRPQTTLAGPSLFGQPAPATPAGGDAPPRFWCLGWGGFRSSAGAVRFHVGYDSPEFENYAVLYLDRHLGLVVLTSGGHGPRSAVPAFVEAVLGPNDTPFSWAGYE